MTGSRDSPDLAGRAYWDGIWRRTGHGGAARFSFFHHAFRRVLDRYVGPGTTACEVGCADSIWIPYLICRGAEITGLDYSEAGMRRLRESLSARGLSATLLGGDLLGDNPFGGRQFDVVYSLGLVEHFDRESRVVAALARALRPGGILITVVPNLAGTWGALQRRLDRHVFDLHVVYLPADLDRIHAEAGLDAVAPAEYFGVFGPLIMHRPSLAERHPQLNRGLMAVLWGGQQLVAWSASLALGRMADSRWLSSHVVGVYRRAKAV
jgi:SAM-dependent methyltransferase